MYSADCGLADSWTRSGRNALFFADTLHVQQLSNQLDAHATAICTSCIGANNTKLALHERRRLYCKEASLPARTVKAWEWVCSSAISQ